MIVCVVDTFSHFATKFVVDDNKNNNNDDDDGGEDTVGWCRQYV